MPRTAPFDKFSNAYEAWFEKHLGVYLSEVEAIRYFLPENGRGLEIGIGTGRFAIPFGIKEGVEPSAAMRKVATRRGLRVYEGVAENLPLADQVFDFALMVTTVCFVDDIYRSFREIHRILKSNGRFVVGLVDAGSRLGRKYREIKANNKFYSIATFYSTAEVVECLKETGFGGIETVQTVFGDLQTINEVQAFKAGHGDGGFAAVKATKLNS
jgi:SAM-dependent methyltransferase